MLPKYIVAITRYQQGELGQGWWRKRRGSECVGGGGREDTESRSSESSVSSLPTPILLMYRRNSWGTRSSLPMCSACICVARCFRLVWGQGSGLRETELLGQQPRGPTSLYEKEDILTHTKETYIQKRLSTHVVYDALLFIYTSHLMLLAK